MRIDQGAIDAHRELVRALAKPGNVLAANGPHTTIMNPVWFSPSTGGPRPRGQRRQLHRRLLDDYVAAQPHVLAQKRALVLAGPPGAGKGHTVDTLFGESQHECLWIDADKLKHALLDEAINDGSYESGIKPAEIAALEAKGEQFFRLELSSLG